MNITKIYNISFRAETPKAQEPKKESKIKELLQKKEAPYIIGASAIAAGIIAIIAIKKGKGSKANHTQSREFPNSKLYEDSTNPPTRTGQESDVIPMGPWDDSEILDNVAHVDVNPEYIEPEIIKQTQYRKGVHSEYLTKYLTNYDILNLKDIDGGTLTPLIRFKYFIKNFDNKIEALIREIHNNYLIDNMNTTGLYRYKKDFVEAFNKIIQNSQSKLAGAKIEESENTILLTQKDGKKILYSFDNGEKGGLRTVKDLPTGKDQSSITLHYLPDMYCDYGKVGINRLNKLEYHNTETGNLIQSITIHPTDRSAHNVVLNNPNTGEPVLIMNRTAKPDNLYYDTTLYQGGKPAININLENNSVLIKQV